MSAPRKPLLVLVSGAPASGKTTLSTAIAGALRLPRINRDELWAGLQFTEARGGPDGVAQRGIVAEYGVLEHLLAVGVSVVADATLYAGESEQSVRRLRDLADVVNVHTRATDLAARYEARQRASGHSEADVAAQVDRVLRNASQTTEPLLLGCAVLEVQADTSWDPSLEDVLAFIRAQ